LVVLFYSVIHVARPALLHAPVGPGPIRFARVGRVSPEAHLLMITPPRAPARWPRTCGMFRVPSLPFRSLAPNRLCLVRTLIPLPSGARNSRGLSWMYPTLTRYLAWHLKAWVGSRWAFMTL